MAEAKYRYHCRPGFGSQELLIEFLIQKADKQFFQDLYEALSPINIKAGEKVDLWMNDEVLQYFTTDQGKFELSVDIWDCIFIMSKSNQKVIHKIDSILKEHPLFEKEEVDFSEYTKVKNNI